MKIVVSGVDPSKIVVEVDNGKVFKRNGKFVVVPKRIDSVTVWVSKKDKLLYTSKYIVKKLTSSEVGLVDSVGRFYSGGLIDKSKLKSLTEVYFNIEGTDFNSNLQIQSFILSAKTHCSASNENKLNKKIHFFTSNSKKLTNEQKELLSCLGDDDRFYIEEIKAKAPDGSIRNVGTVMYKFKETDY